MSNLEQTVTEILNINKQFQDRSIFDFNGEQLSRVALKLAAYKVHLGEEEAQLRGNVEALDAAYDAIKDETFSRERASGKSIADAENQKRIQTEDIRQKLITARLRYRKISNLYSDCHVMIDAIKSRLIQMQQEKGESRWAAP